MSLSSNELLLLHQLFLRGLHCCIDKWPVVIIGKSKLSLVLNLLPTNTWKWNASCTYTGDLLKLFTPMFTIYHKFIGDHTYASEVISLLSNTPR